MKSKKLFFHIGAHKTGTTLLQNILELFKDDMQKMDLCYDSEWGHLLVESLSRKSFDRSDLLSLKEAFRERCRMISETTIVFSNENFFGDPFKNYENFSKIAHGLREVTEGFETHLVMGVRRQDTFVESLYHQYVKQGGDKNLEDFADMTDFLSFDWWSLTEVCRRLFGEKQIHVFPFEMILGNRNTFLNMFFNILGRDTKFKIRNLPVFNPSYSWKGLEIARISNAFLDERERAKLRDFLQKNFAKAPEEAFALLEEQERYQLLSSYKTSNYKLFSRYIGNIAPEFYFPESDMKTLLQMDFGKPSSF
jgi:hypothetical protein